MIRDNAGLVVILTIIVVVVAALMLNDGGAIGSLDPGEFARGSYLSIIAVVLGGSVLAAARHNIPAAMRAFGFWALAFVGLIGLYAYRDEFREIGDRVLAEVIPGHAIEVAGGDGRTVMVARSDDDHFHVDAKVDGETVRFLVDTGATTVAIDRATASRLGYDISDESFTDWVQTANGVARSAPVTIASLKIGGIERRNVRAAVMGEGGSGSNLLGMSFLGTLSSFDFQGSKLVLTD
ncbi:retropepsin-like aspartic protease family protein [Aureimonas leprariae]|uniref:TIGR02281 family clan AA aspartic protease n=1 Tax=Plantimonas leprariae TaxID=2615207 RepID=A0A7V7TXM6_9HYPH|nr:TIGR02281 family clan AA aspartic protease [Aureimonas leprariae]KAB0681894.1 TIGR02281 family clan AA aspartic protease [Aureimonas leprariae]